MTARSVFGLDVVRAAAVLLVVAAHCGDIFAGWFHTTNYLYVSYGAYFGIELFFVLSGLLIGGLLIEQMDRPDQHLLRSWRIFMIRRWMRTLPLYYLWLLVLAVLWAPILWHDGRRLALALLAYGTLLQNLAWPMRGDGFFDVTWSLAVEEWFYLGFSALLLGLARFVSARAAFFLAIIGFLVIPVGLRLWLRQNEAASDHLVILWLDQIGIGVVAAWVAARHARLFQAGVWLLPVVPALIWLIFNDGLARFGISLYWRHALDFDLVAGTLVLTLPAASLWREASGPVAALIRFISRTSYALYLIHLSVVLYINDKRAAWHLSPIASVALSVVAIVLVAYAMSRWVERPVMARRPDDRAARPVPISPSMPAADAPHAHPIESGA